MLGNCFVGLMMANEEGCVDKYLKLLAIVSLIVDKRLLS